MTNKDYKNIREICRILDRIIINEENTLQIPANDIQSILSYNHKSKNSPVHVFLWRNSSKELKIMGDHISKTIAYFNNWV